MNRWKMIKVFRSIVEEKYLDSRGIIRINMRRDLIGRIVRIRNIVEEKYLDLRGIIRINMRRDLIGRIVRIRNIVEEKYLDLRGIIRIKMRFDRKNRENIKEETSLTIFSYRNY